MKNYVQKGDRLQFANSTGGTIASGSGVLVSKRVGVAVADIPNTTTGVLAMEGVFNLPKLTTDVVAQGDILYWDNTNKRLTTTASGNTQAGYAQAAAGNGVTTVDVMLNR
jgi:predicted RecA/RadA family phage recombinase